MTGVARFHVCIHLSVPVNGPFDPGNTLQCIEIQAMSHFAKSASYLGILGLTVLVGSATALRAQTNPSQGPNVVELYTSQGCSSTVSAGATVIRFQMPLNVSTDTSNHLDSRRPLLRRRSLTVAPVSSVQIKVEFWTP
jgi:hypothetical protein